MENKNFQTNKILFFLKENWILLAILIMTLVIRIFFFIETNNQAVWWDESSYLSAGLHYSNGIPFMIEEIRPPLYQYMIAGLILIDCTDRMIILLLTLIPSVLLVYFIYLLVKEMLNETSGLIAAAFAAVSWNFIFWSNRAQPDFISLCLQVLAVYYFWKMLKVEEDPTNNNKRYKLAAMAAMFAALGFYFKISALLVPLSLAVFVLIKDRFVAFKKSEYWIYLLSYVACFIPYCVWSYISFGNMLPFVSPYSTNVAASMPLGWGALLFFNVFGLNVMFWTFLMGMVLCLKILLYGDLILKNKSYAFDYRLLVIVLVGVVLSFYIFYIKQVEDRWVFLLLPIMCLLCASVLYKVYDMLSLRNLKWVGVLLILVILSVNAYEQVKYAGSIIDNKKDSYSPVKDAAEWMKANSGPTEIIMSISYPQTVWYSKRHVETYSIWNETYLTQYIDSNHPKFLTISIYEPHPSWIYAYIENNTRFVPVMGYFQDVQKTKPSLIIYKID
jgi:4-amino-4-deoxy-L-arabinose transferase-like glycosyltransferase